MNLIELKKTKTNWYSIWGWQNVNLRLNLALLAIDEHKLTIIWGFESLFDTLWQILDIVTAHSVMKCPQMPKWLSEGENLGFRSFLDVILPTLP
jgi:hypothetical protein